MRQIRKLNYIPEILYHAPEYEGQKPDPIPFISIPKDKDMPVGLFIMEYKKTGEYQPGPEGLDEEIEEGPFPHMYVDFDYLIECMSILFPDLDIDYATREIRTALGLKPTKSDSQAAGEKIFEKVAAKENEIREKLTAKKQAKINGAN